MKKKLSKEQIEEKRNVLLEQFKKSSENLKNGRSSPTQEFMDEISEEIKKASLLGLPASQMARGIKTVFGITISATTIRGYIKNKLGMEVKKSKKNEVSQGAKHGKSSAKTMQEMKETIKNKPQEEDSL